MKRLLFSCTVMLLLALASEGRAHSRSVSYSSIRVAGQQASVAARVSLLDASLLEGAGVKRAELGRYVAERLVLSSSGGDCSRGPLLERKLDPAWIDFEWEVSCPEGALTLESSLLRQESPAHLHLCRVSVDGAAPSEHVLDARASQATLARAGKSPGSFGRFVLLGMEHIVTGWDHLLFLAMLLLAQRSVRQAALAVTGFTLGHSLTLGLTAFGVLLPSERPVEALIALSIGLLATENVWLEERRERATLPCAAVGAVLVAALVAFSRAPALGLGLAGMALFSACYFGLMARSEHPERWRTVVAALFGSIHGFGFARVLTELELPPVRLFSALVGFNLGVELGQILCLLLAFPLLLVGRRLLAGADLVRVGASAALCLACYWFVMRVLGA